MCFFYYYFPQLVQVLSWILQCFNCWGISFQFEMYGKTTRARWVRCWSDKLLVLRLKWQSDFYMFISGHCKIRNDRILRLIKVVKLMWCFGKYWIDSSVSGPYQLVSSLKFTSIVVNQSYCRAEWCLYTFKFLVEPL